MGGEGVRRGKVKWGGGVGGGGTTQLKIALREDGYNSSLKS